MPNLRQGLLIPLVNPSIALMVLVVDLTGVYFEFSNPGLIARGADGGILVIVGLMALSLPPLNFAGAALILLAVVFRMVEAMTPVNGILASISVAWASEATVLQASGTSVQVRSTRGTNTHRLH